LRTIYNDRYAQKLAGHANCVKFVKSFNKPLLLLGGGGYTMRNVSRAWAYETGLAAGVELGPEIPVNEYYEYFGPDYELDVKSSNTDDLNTPAYLDRVKRIVLENLRHAGGPPSVQMTDIPSMPIDAAIEDPNEDEDLIDPNDRRPMRLLDSRRQADGELSDSDDEGEGGRRDHATYRDGESGDSNGAGHKFGLGGGILNAGSLASHAGPSSHTTAARMSSINAGETSMDVDSPSTESNTGGLGTELPATSASESVASVDKVDKNEAKSEKGDDEKMVVDPDPEPAL